MRLHAQTRLEGQEDSWNGSTGTSAYARKERSGHSARQGGSVLMLVWRKRKAREASVFVSRKEKQQ